MGRALSMMATAIDRERPRSGAWASVIVILILTMVSFLDRHIISLMVTDIRASLDITDFQVSLLQGAAFGVVYALSALPFGYAADVAPRRLVIFAGVLVWAGAAVACGFATTFAALLIARMGVGFGEAALGPSAYSLLSDLFPPRRLALAISVCAVGTLVGAAMALAFGAIVLSWARQESPMPGLEPWQIAFIVTGAPGLAAAFLVFAMPEPPRRESARAGWGELWSFVRSRRALLACHIGGFACCMLLVYAQIAWLPTILQRTYDWSIAAIGVTFATFSLATGLSGLLLNGALVDTWFARGANDAHLRYYAWAMLIVAASGALAPFASGAWTYLAVLAPASMILNFIGVGAAALQIVSPPRLRGRVSALFLAIISLVGITLGPSVTAFFTDFVLRDESAVQASLAATYLVFAPLAAALFAAGLPHLRRAVALASRG